MSAKATLHNCRRSERVGWHRLTSARDNEAMRAVPGRRRAVCSATRLSLCVPTSRAFATSALIQGCTQVLELSEGGSNGNRARNAHAAAVAMRASAGNSLLLTLAVSSCTTHFLSSPSRQFYLWALCNLETLVTSASTTRTSKNRHTFRRNDILHHTVCLLLIHSSPHIFYIIES